MNNAEKNEMTKKAWTIAGQLGIEPRKEEDWANYVGEDSIVYFMGNRMFYMNGEKNLMDGIFNPVFTPEMVAWYEQATIWEAGATEII